MAVEVSSPVNLWEDASLFRWCGMTLGRAQKAGEITTHRGPVGEGSTALIAYDGQRAVGMAVFYKHSPPPAIWLDLFWVAPSHRRQGVGTALMAGFLTWAQGKAPRIEFGTGVDNQAMQALGRKAGFVPMHIVFGMQRRVG